MLKRSRTVILILLLFSYSCVEKQQATETKVFPSQYQINDVVGVWNVFHVEITKGRYKESSKNPILYKTNYLNDSLIIEFRDDFTFSINQQMAGNWFFKNDSIKIINKANNVFPLNINSTYQIHKGYFGKNWYLYTNFYDKNGEVSHSLRIVAKRGVPK